MATAHARATPASERCPSHEERERERERVTGRRCCIRLLTTETVSTLLGQTGTGALTG